MKHRRCHRRRVRICRISAFSLIEVVLALGVVSFAIVAILGVLPAGLQTGKSSQDETRATQLAQSILSSMASQSQTNFNAMKLLAGGGTPINLADSSTNQLYANNDGVLSDSPAGAVYNVVVTCDSNVAPDFDPGFANKVTVQVRWPMNPAPTTAPAPNQSYRDYVRIISKY